MPWQARSLSIFPFLFPSLPINHLSLFLVSSLAVGPRWPLRQEPNHSLRRLYSRWFLSQRRIRDLPKVSSLCSQGVDASNSLFPRLQSLADEPFLIPTSPPATPSLGTLSLSLRNTRTPNQSRVNGERNVCRGLVNDGIALERLGSQVSIHVTTSLLSFEDAERFSQGIREASKLQKWREETRRSKSRSPPPSSPSRFLNDTVLVSPLYLYPFD